SNRIQYTIHTEISKPASLELLNSAGKSVLRITEVPQAGIINIQSLKTGIYTLILSHRYDKWFEKVLVVNKDG
ncbi:MAG TPA: T9SS type A sorting domain-containing protein, partial [Bacteroidales bacterium]|nr:T9SS type A sorting domain-containing protein [Bacteroidales bacterium]